MSAAANSPVADSTTPAWVTPVELGVLGAIWGASFLFMRISANDFGPYALVEVRLILGTAILLPFLIQAFKRFGPKHWWKVLGIAAINTAIPFTLFAWAAQRAPAGIGAITNAMAVMFTALMAFLIYKEKISGRRMIGLLLGFIGVAVLASGKTAGEAVWPAALAGTLAALMYGIGGNLIRHHLADVPAAPVAAATLLCASAWLAPLALATWPQHPIPTTSWVSAAMLGVLCSGIAYFLYYRLIYRIGAPRASTVTYLVPFFGVIWAWLFLSEAITLTMIIAGALILAGVGLSQQRAK